MYSAISAITPRLFPQQLPVPNRLPKLTANDSSTPRTEIPRAQQTSNYIMPAPTAEILKATALASWAPFIAKTYIEQDKKKESEAITPDYTIAA